MRTSVFMICAFALAVAQAERQPYERYQTIVDRQMFGAPPPGFDPTKMPSEVAKTSAKADKELTQEQEQVKKSIKFSVINVTSAGETVVGFSDNGDPKNPLHYYLKVGESQNGWTVKEADKDEATMTIANKDGIEVTLKLGGDSASNAAAVSRAGAAKAPNGLGANTGSSLLGGGLRSLRERRRQREEQIRADEAAKHAADTAAREAADKAREEREAAASQQREAEREEQRKQLMQIQEELRKAREAREAQKTQEAETTAASASE